jgi:hypothetical protein
VSRRWWRAIRPALWVLAGLLASQVLLARAGGGESYSGGGSSSSGGGGGGGDGGLIWLLIRLWFEFVIRYPLIGVPLTIVILI